MEFLIQHVFTALGQVWHTFSVNWPFLLVSTLVAALLKQLLKPDRMAAFLQKHSRAGVLAATTVAVTTPLCSCGTTAMILGMMANLMPWAPIVAFMVSSPLTSPQELIYSAGLFGWPFALAFFLASILLGLAGGLLAGVVEGRGWLKGQARLQASPKIATPATSPILVPVPATFPSFNFASSQQLTLAPQMASAPVQSQDHPNSGAQASSIGSCGCGAEPSSRSKIDGKALLADILNTGKALLVFFLAFAFVGYFLNGLIPAAWISTLFGSGKAYGVPLAATLGLPFYINTEASLPLVRAMLDSGMSSGAALAFLITGAGTSIGALAGAMTIARWRVIALVIGTLWVGSILIGFAYNLLTVP